MNELVAITIFAGCLGATFALIRVCSWLGPSGPPVAGEVPRPSGREEVRR